MATLVPADVLNKNIANTVKEEMTLLM